MSQSTDQREDGTDGTTVLRFSGSLTIQEIEELKKVLLEAIEQSDRVMIDCSGATKMDFAWLQLLCSAHRNAMAAGKNLKVTEPIPEGLQALKSEAGFDRHCSCPLSDAEDNCIWVGIGHEK